MMAGLVAVVLGAVLAAVWAAPFGGWLAWGVSVAMFLFGMFGLFEAAMGWCACRAMGFKTRI